MSSSWKDLLSTFNVKTLSPQNDERATEHRPQSLKDSDNKGLIFTDTAVLASKFGVEKRVIKDALGLFILNNKGIGHNWVLFDIADLGQGLNSMAEDDNLWLAYHRLLHTFIEINNIIKNCATSVFIIGGNDVIPFPHEPIILKSKPYDLQIDLLYCFPEGYDFSERLLNLCKTHSSYDTDLFISTMLKDAVCNVSRLPLDDGPMDRTFEETIGYYFERSIGCNSKICTNTVLMTTATQWLSESTDMVNGLPLLPIDEDPTIVFHGMYTAPHLCYKKHDEESYGMDKYVQSLKEADYLLFNLHGNDVREDTGYSGIDSFNKLYCVFDIGILPLCKAKILSTAACFGARYKDYGFDYSLLLSSIYSSFLVFVGSCEVSFGTINPYLPCCCCSEALLKIYTHYILQGIPCGEAMLRSKIDYFVHFSPFESTHGEDPFTLFTIYEFNIFGAPHITCTCHNNVSETQLPIIKNTGAEKALNSIISASRPVSLDEAYDRVRGLVDKNLEEIATSLERMLQSEYHFNNLNLTSAARQMDQGILVGYVFSYTYSINGELTVYADKKGNLSKVFYTK